MAQSDESHPPQARVTRSGLLFLPAEGFALEYEVALLSLGGGLGKGCGCLGGEAFLEVGVFRLFGQVVPFVGIFLDVVEFLGRTLSVTPDLLACIRVARGGLGFRLRFCFRRCLRRRGRPSSRPSRTSRPSRACWGSLIFTWNRSLVSLSPVFSTTALAIRRSFRELC